MVCRPVFGLAIKQIRKLDLISFHLVPNLLGPSSGNSNSKFNFQFDGLFSTLDFTVWLHDKISFRTTWQSDILYIFEEIHKLVLLSVDVWFLSSEKVVLPPVKSFSGKAVLYTIRSSGQIREINYIIIVYFCMPQVYA